MKYLMSAVFILFTSTIFFGQEITVTTDKTEYKIDEPITLIYEVDGKVDSQSGLTGTNFKRIDGPKNKQTSSTTSGKTTATFTASYKLKAIMPGTMEVISPKFRFGSTEKSGKNVVVKISADKLTETEIDAIKFNEFKENNTKQNGAMRFVISENYGFIEKYNGSQWEFKRRLSKEEILALAKQ